MNVIGNNYENVNISGGNAQLGDVYHNVQQSSAESYRVLAQLQALEQTLAQSNHHFEAQEKSRRDERLTDIQKWIAGPAAYNHHEQALKIHQEYPSTGLWISHHTAVVAWMKDDLPRNPILWVHGIPGAGICPLICVVLHLAYSVQVRLYSLRCSSNRA